MQSLARVVPAPISEEMTKKVQQTATEAFLAIGGEGISRIDLMIDEDSGELFVNEINTIPGSLSFYLWEHCDLSFTQLLDKLIALAFKRQRNRQGLLSSFETNLLETASFGGSKGAKGGKL
jgi:D-alanine-D-alanine ligase